jgi:hypothetical protein
LLWEFTADYRNPDASLDEVMNGNGGYSPMTFVRVEEDGSLTPYYYGHVNIRP